MPQPIFQHCRRALVDPDPLGMAVLNHRNRPPAHQHHVWRIEAGAQLAAMNAVVKAGAVTADSVGGGQAGQLLPKGRRHQVIRIETQQPVALDTGFLEGETPLRRVVVEAPLDKAGVGKAAHNRFCSVIGMTIHHHHLPRPGQRRQTAADVGFLVIGQDDGGDAIQHRWKRPFWQVFSSRCDPRGPAKPSDCGGRNLIALSEQYHWLYQ